MANNKFTITYENINSNVKGVYTTNSKTEALKKFCELCKTYEIVDINYRNF